MTLLITAFGDFDGGWNASDRLLTHLEADRARLEQAWGAPVAFTRLAVDTEGIGHELDRALDAIRPTHLLLMGQATARDALALERVARNARDLRAPDACGRMGALGPVEPDGPLLRRATWPGLGALGAALSAAGLPAETSDDAGGHLCNQALYLALGRPAAPLAAFLHLPLMREQVAAGLPCARRRPGAAGMPVTEMARAVGLILRHTRAMPSTGAIA
ncbi:pyroglutamyl-peptidase [Methylopila jiangsuensis]|nr:hypothetical protein [Methylopila jiangsuensis]MDR6286610.1 pyroglutamyl-peptidase [Methylopila jiangsuensis]